MPNQRQYRPARSQGLWCRMGMVACVATALIAGSVVVAPAADDGVFDALVNEIQTNPRAATEAQAARLLGKAREQGRPYVASLLMETFFSNHPQASAQLVAQAGDIALLAGQFIEAADRYKLALDRMPASEEASEVAARLYHVLIHMLRDGNDAYQVMLNKGLQLRHSPHARRYDAWFLSQARRRRDLNGLVAGIRAMLADRPEVGVQDLIILPHLRQIIMDLRHAHGRHAELVDDLGPLVERAAFDDEFKRQASFLLALEAYFGAVENADDDERRSRFGPVVRVARRYVEGSQNRVSALRFVCQMWMGDWHQVDQNRWRDNRQAKFAFVVAMLNSMDDASKQAFAQWQDRDGNRMVWSLAGPDEWAMAGLTQPDYLDHPSFTGRLAFIGQGRQQALLNMGSGQLSDHRSPYAGVLRALQSSQSLEDVLVHFVDRESALLSPAVTWRMLSEVLWPSWREMHDGDDDAWRQALVSAGIRSLGRTPLSIYSTRGGFVQAYLDALWRTSSRDRRELIEGLQVLTWATFSDDRAVRDLIDNGIRRNFHGWRGNVQRDISRSRGDARESDLVHVEAIDALLDQLRTVQTVDRSTAGNDLQRALSELVMADSRNDGDGYRAAAAQVLQRAMGPDADSPMAFYAMRVLLGPAPNRRGTIDVQCQALAHIADRFGVDRLVTATRWLSHGNNDWLGNIRENDREHALKVHAVLARALQREVAAGRLPRELFDQWRNTRNGRGWMAREVGNDIMRRILDQDLIGSNDLYGSDWPRRNNAVVAAQIVRSEFPELHGNYPPEQWFDERVAAEIRASGYADIQYYSFGRDPRRLVINAVAEQFAGMRRLPFGNDGQTAYGQSDFEDWLDRIFRHAEGDVQQRVQRAAEQAYPQRIDDLALGDRRFHAWDLSEEPERRQPFFTALREHLPRLQAAHRRAVWPQLGSLNTIEADDYTQEELDVVVQLLATSPPSQHHRGRNPERVARVVHALEGRKAWSHLHSIIPELWRIDRDVNHRWFREFLVARVEGAIDEGHYEYAQAMATSGLQIGGGQLESRTRSTLESAVRRARASVGQRNPYAEDDPRWPVAESQMVWQTGRHDTAWEYYVRPGVADQAQDMLAELNPQFPLWLIERSIALEELENAEVLARSMTMQFDQRDPGAELRAQLALLLADVSFARREYPSARAQYRAVAESRDFAGTRARLDAELGMGNVDRVQGRHDAALELFSAISERNDARARSAGLYHMALTMHEQGSHQDAYDTLTLLLHAFPHHVDGKILRSEVFIELGKFGEATHIDISSLITQRILQPGQPFRAEMVDTNRVLVRHAKSVHLRVWTEKSGDEEELVLTLYGDSNDRFTGTLNTRLGEGRPGNNVLEVLGGDTVYFDFTDEFKREIQYQGPDNEAVLRVVTNASLQASSGEILSEQEMERERLRQMIMERQGLRQEQEVVALSQRRMANQIRPGNEINIRVRDLDRSVTSQPDTIHVRASCTSGDVVEAFPLVETGPNTGEFVGSLPTAPRPPTAMASDSAVGTDPNMAISPNLEFPAWMGGRVGDQVRTFSVDFNDYVEMDRMRIQGEEDRALRHVVVQTSANNRDFSTVAAWPEEHLAWTGRLQAEVLPWWGSMPSGVNASAVLQEAFDINYRLREQTGKYDFAPSSGTLHVDWQQDLNSVWSRIDNDHRRPPGYLMRVRQAIYVDQRQERTFTLVPHADYDPENTSFLFLINGRPRPQAARGEVEESMDYTVEMGRGVHIIEVYAMASRNRPQEGTFKIMWDIAAEPYRELVPSPQGDPRAQIIIDDHFAREKVTIEPADGHGLDIAFAGNGARVVRLWILQHEGDAPAIRKISLNNTDGEQILPTAECYTVLRENMQLELIPGDDISIVYNDPSVIGDSRSIHEQRLRATFVTGSLRAALERSTPGARGTVQSSYVGLRRFEIGEPIRVFISDADKDVSPQPDRVPFTVTTSLGESVTIEAVETGDHSGVFMGTVFPVAGNPARADQLRTEPGDDLTISYVDEHNLDQGIPWTRSIMVEQVVWRDPEMRVHKVVSEPLEQQRESEQPETRSREVRPSHRLVVERPAETTHGATVSAVLGGPLIVEVLWPTAARATDSTVTFYAQTSRGRDKAGRSSGDRFDLSVPGTVALTTTPGAAGAGALSMPMYAGVSAAGTRVVGSALDVGLFSVNIPMELGALPEHSFAEHDDGRYDGLAEANVLMVSPEDSIYVAFRYEDRDGRERWLTTTVRLAGDALFDVMDRQYSEDLTGIYVGDRMYMRVVDPMQDVSDEQDRVTIHVTNPRGDVFPVELVETASHSGTFQGLARVVHEDELDQIEGGVNLVPARYGDVLTLRYVDGGQTIERQVEVYRGSDGSVVPFTKRFRDPDMAVRTQFSIAEAYFELAKQHRALARDAERQGRTEEHQQLQSLSRREIRMARNTLNEALRDFPDNPIRAQSDYLLAELEMEYGDEAVDESAKMASYQRAVALFTSIVANHPNSEYAPRAQFKKALAFHKMQELDRALEEYVKLSYMYPDSEFVADTIVHLGRYFLTRGSVLERRAGQESDEVEAEKMRIEARRQFRTAGEVFSRLRERFPGHELMAQTTVLAGMCLMRAGRWEEAVANLDEVIDDRDLDAPNVKAEALYWRGDTFLRSMQSDSPLPEAAAQAYRSFQRLIWDYPETRWARFARGRMAEERALQGQGN